MEDSWRKTEGYLWALEEVNVTFVDFTSPPCILTQVKSLANSSLKQ